MFLIPILNELLREKEQGALSDGVRAIFIYPMNALANDQIKGLREILMEYPDIKFGVYNGGTEHREADAIKLYEAMYENEQHPKLRHRLENELLSRDEMKKRRRTSCSPIMRCWNTFCCAPVMMSCFHSRLLSLLCWMKPMSMQEPPASKRHFDGKVKRQDMR